MSKINLTQLKPNELIKVLLAAKGLTQTSLASALGVSNSAISRKITGENSFSSAEYSKMADLFGVSVDSLLGREPLEVA